MTGRQCAVRAVGAFRSGSDWRKVSRNVQDPRERALSDNITHAVIRNLYLIDYHIARVSSLPLDKIEPRIHDILRCALAQIMFLDKIPVSAAVNEAVKDTGDNERARAFVNAVLRALTRTENPARQPDVVHEARRGELSIKYSHTREYVTYLGRRYGDETAVKILEADNTIPEICCAVNTSLTNIDEVITALSSEGIEAKRIEGNLFTLTSAGQMLRLQAFREGMFYVQDPGAYRVAELCGAKPYDVIFDVCAAPGGKAVTLSLLTDCKSRIYAFDIESRISLIKDNTARLKLTNITANAANACILSKQLVKKADIVLVDAPCSGFGAIRKKPEIRYKTFDSVVGLKALQLDILSNVCRYVKPGGKLVYATCTTLESENENVVDGFLQKQPEFHETHRENILPSLSSDGFFISVLVND